ncbi:hypothetical protein ACS0TY_030315 [Phlomoides rotata]
MESFSAIKSCWGGGSGVIPAAEEEMEEKCTDKATHWKPMLQTISEECTTLCVDSRRIPETEIKKRPPVKARTKLALRARPPPYCHGKDNWKSYSKITLPALSPTPFLF